MEDSADENWQTLLSDDPDLPREDLETFWEDVADFKRKYLSSDALELHRNFILTIKKPRSMTVANFTHRLDFLISIVVEFPGAQDIDKFTQEQYKSLYVRAMPEAWQAHFIRAGRRCRDNSKTELVEYFANLEELSENRNPKKESKTSTDNNANNRQHKRSNNNRNRKRTDKKGNADTSSDNSKTPPKELTNEMTCPVHGGHRWGKCILNPRGDNYREYKPEKQNYNRKKAGKPKQNNHESHANECESSDEEMCCFECEPVQNVEFDETVELELAEYESQVYIAPTKTEFELPLATTWKEDNFIPETIVTIGKIGGAVTRTNLNCLMDSGGSTNLIKLSTVPRGATMIQTESITVVTAAGKATACAKNQIE
ncbi:MAG: hypothetical protein ACREBR_01250 [bacterium]